VFIAVEEVRKAGVRVLRRRKVHQD